MRHAAAVCVLVLFIPSVLFSSSSYDLFFTGKTMRVDYFHGGTKATEWFSLDQVYQEESWAGSVVNLIDTLNLGEYAFRVYDRATGAMIYSRGYSTIFNEWQTTDEALNGLTRTFSETARFPFPKRPVQLTIVHRDKDMVMHEIFSLVIDPTDPTQVNKEMRSAGFKVTPLMTNGDPTQKVDIVIVGDGYGPTDMERFRQDAQHFNDVMFETEPFAGRRKDFNVRMAESESRESGIDVPDKGVWKGNVLGSQYNTFGSARYILTTDNKAVRDVAGAAPYDFICILINDKRYGGGGIYNLYATTYTREETRGQEWQRDYVYVHEFGHSFAGLGDEYYSSSTGYNDFYKPGVEPWEPNVTALLDPKNVKWKVTPGIPVPTPWEKAEYDSISAEQGKLNRLAPDYYEKREPFSRKLTALRKNSVHAGKVGAFEGSGYSAKGLYRPSVDCRMFSLSLVGFDPVCTDAIIRMIDFYAK